ncbi:tetratricopeptide repeat protein [Eudoraea chungangensis]|uniref:tetratricopeptide repeat protein n=1 Tax=Eudoraea chungangensis TaxID=1481905 RepID=UPI0023EB1DEB|nr:tetratricopeptide repeat protein [Eudoraea chungangensis]
MKTKLLFLMTIFCVMVGFSQKAELKAADKALKSGDTASAKASLDGIEGMMSGADEKVQADYYFMRGKVYADLANKGDNSAFNEAATSFQKVLDLEANGKKKYTDETSQRVAALSADLVNSAVEDNGNKKFEEASDKLYMSYKISPADTVYLYYAASSAVNGGHYDKALGYYEELMDVGYDGSGTVYKATNVANGQVEEMDKTQRDLMIKSGAYKDPIDEKTPSKQAEIVKNMALIYTQTGQDEKALEAFSKARKSNPDDVNLVLNEANLHFKLGDKDKFKMLMSEAAAMEPNNPDLQYNIGVINMQQGNIEEARKAYRKAIEINPGYVNAQLNLSTTYVDEGNAFIDEMNSLGNSKADIARYDELKKQKDDLFREGATILEEGLKTNPGNQSVLTQLKNIYGALGDTENFMKVKKLLGE